MKLHYVALRKDMFLYMDILYTQIFKWKGILFSGVGGISSLPGGINGVSGMWGREPLGSPIITKRSQQLMSCSLCQIYCTRHSGAGSFRECGTGSTVWYSVSHFAFPWTSAKGRKQYQPCLSDGKTPVSVCNYSLSSW